MSVQVTVKLISTILGKVQMIQNSSFTWEKEEEGEEEKLGWRRG